MKIQNLFLACLVVFSSCCRSTWTSWEKKVIDLSDSVMYVTVMPLDSAILRTPSIDVPASALKSPELETLLAKMLSTLQDPSQDGVGIAAPQVVINRRIICVQRFDKSSEPFECYVNVRIDSLYGDVCVGPEGCLSLPPLRGYVPRWTKADISYASLPDGTRISETVSGFTAIIFQHECDHLDGILYTDRADTVFVSTSWASERAGYTYDRPSWWDIPR